MPGVGGSRPFRRNASWSPTGEVLAYTVQDGSQHDIWAVSPNDTSSARPLLDGPANEHSPKFSPDGRWLAYASNESGRYEVYVRRYPQGERLRVSTEGGEGPVWSPNRRELFFSGPYEGTPKLMVASVAEDGETLRIGVPTPLLDMRVIGPEGAFFAYLGASNNGPSYDILPDGQRFVMVRLPDAPELEIILVQNFFEELKRLVPN